MSLAIHILVVEDHHDNAEVIWRLLSGERYRVTIARSLAEVRALAHTFRFGFVICDLGLPDGDGCDALAMLRKLYPIEGIALTGYGMPQDIERCKQAGFAAHLTKPVDFQKLLATIQQHMPRSELVAV